ncbi:hypothetical protein LTR60_003526, partial [Cryomyces antarcticus]
SRNIGVFGNNAKDTGIPSDVWRYYLLSMRPETGDSEFEWKGFIDANNNELLKNFGNFVNRIVKFVNSKVYDNVIPDYTYTDDLKAHIAEVNTHLKQYIAELDAVKLKAALATSLHISYLGNKLLQENHLDNSLAASNPSKCAAVAGLAINHVHLLASIFRPYLPSTSDSILAQLQASLLIIPDEWQATSIAPGHTIGKAAYLFSQIKPEKENEWREKFGGAEAQKQRDEKAAKAAAKKADKERKKAQKDAKAKEAKAKEQEQDGDANPATQGKSVEAVEKDGAQALHDPKTAIEEVTQGAKQVTLQTS